LPKYLNTAVVISFFAFANPTLADPPPERPDDYVKSLLHNQWTFAKFLWGDRKPCDAESCMGGFYSPPLMLSVQLEKDSDDDMHSIEAVATIEGCESLGWNLMWEKDYENLRRAKRIEYVESRVASLAEKMAKTCKTKLAGPVPLVPLERFFPN
jgi:hypothetical protein